MHLRGLSTAVILVTIIGCGDDKPNPVGSTVQYEASAAFDFGYPVTTQTQFILSAVSGSVDIVGVPNLDSVYIEGIRRIVSGTSQADADHRLSALQVSTSSSGNQISVETDQPQNTEGRQYLVEYEIRMPANMLIDVFQVAGTIEISSTHNSVTLENVAGAVNLYDVTGDLAAHVASGAISVSCELQTGGSVNLVTVAGSISLIIPTSTSASFQANTAAGIVTVNNLVLSNPVILTNSVTGILGGGDGTINLQATAGDIDVTGT